MNKFGERLKKLRIEKGLSIDTLSKAIGISRSALSSWENKNVITRASFITKLAKYYKVSCDYLLGLKD